MLEQHLHPTPSAGEDRVVVLACETEYASVPGKLVFRTRHSHCMLAIQFTAKLREMQVIIAILIVLMVTVLAVAIRMIVLIVVIVVEQTQPY